MPFKILLTGFEPFGKDEQNPSSEAINRISQIDGMEIRKLVLPVTWSGAFVKMLSVWNEFDHDGLQ